MLEPREPTSFELLPTPHLGTRVVRLRARQEFIRATTSITEGMTVAAFIAALNVAGSDVLTAGYGDYVLTAPAPAGSGYLGFDFAPPATSLKVNALTPWSEKTIWMDYTWPDVLRYLYAMTGVQNDEESTGLSGVTLLTDYKKKVLTLDRYELVQGGEIPTQVIVRRYLTPGLITGLRAERPMPQPVRYAWNRLVNSLNCLHDEVIIPEILSEAQLVPGFGTENGSSYADLGQQVFPRTNFLTWQKHIFRVEQSDVPQNGLYETVTYEALPPPMPEGQLLAG